VGTGPGPSTPPSSKRRGQLATAGDDGVVLWVFVVVVVVVGVVVVVIEVLVVVVGARVGRWADGKRSATATVVGPTHLEWAPAHTRTPRVKGAVWARCPIPDTVPEPARPV
jgi:hypothetical protein